MLVRICLRPKRKLTFGGRYCPTIEEMYDISKVSPAERIKPWKVAKIILADDDVLSSMALRAMIESTREYKAVPFYNGLEVT